MADKRNYYKNHLYWKKKERHSYKKMHKCDIFNIFSYLTLGIIVRVKILNDENIFREIKKVIRVNGAAIPTFTVIEDQISFYLCRK